MPIIDAGLRPGPEATRLAAEAVRQVAELERLHSDLVGGLRALGPTDRCLAWRAQAASEYDARLRLLHERLGFAIGLVAEACETHRRLAVRLRVIAEAPGFAP